MNRKQRRGAQSMGGGPSARAAMAAHQSATPINLLLAEISAHLQARRLVQAIACLKRLIVLRPGSADDHNTLALVLRAAGRLDEAARAFQRALSLDPSRQRASLDLA